MVLGRNLRRLLILLRKKLKSNNSPTTELKRMFTVFLEQCLAKWLAEAEEDRAMRTRPLTEDELEDHLETLSLMETESRETLAFCDYEKISKHVDELIIENEAALVAAGINGIAKDSEPYRKLCRDLLKTYVRFFEIEQQRTVGDYGHISETGSRIEVLPQVQTAGQPVTASSGLTSQEAPSLVLTELIKQYSDEQKRGNRWTAKTAGETQASFALMVAIVGDVPIKTVTNLRDFKNKLLTLPPNYRKSPKYRNKSITELLSMAEEGKIEKALSVITINKHLTRATSLFKWAMQNGFIDRNPAEGLQIATTKRDDEYRAVFNDDDLIKLFHSRDYLKDTHKHGYRFWLPVLALFTGARLTELCQLYLEDIHTVEPERDGKSVSRSPLYGRPDGLYVIDINDKGDKKLKTPKSSRRIVPLHDFLVKDLNLPGFVEKLRSQGQTRLFPELKRRKEGYGKTASKWFGEYRQRCGFKLSRKSSVSGATWSACPASDEGRKDFHSFRHTVTNTLKQIGVEQTVISELIGHSSGSITFGRYGKRYSPRVVKEQAIDKLNYRIDLNHLKQSRFIVNK
jgi:integrase